MRTWLLLPPLGLAGLIASILLLALTGGDGLVLPLIALLLLSGSAGAMFWLARMARRVRDERRALLQLDEQLSLRHTGPALVELLRRLNEPLQMPRHRVMAFEQLSRALYTLGRYDESADAAQVVLESPAIDPVTAFGVGCNRAMALLRADRLFDAGDAIGRLRREATRIESILDRPDEDSTGAGKSDEEPDAEREITTAVSIGSDEGVDPWTDPPRAAEAEQGPQFSTARLVLVEMYRDIQTRHNGEAIEAFEANRPDLVSALGLRVGDAHGLAASAYLRQERLDEARQAWADAIALVAPGELLRRYPELREVAAFADHAGEAS